MKIIFGLTVCYRRTVDFNINKRYIYKFNIYKCMNTSKFKKLIKECITEIQYENSIEKKKKILKRAKEIIKEIKDLGKQEFNHIF